MVRGSTLLPTARCAIGELARYDGAAQRCTVARRTTLASPPTDKPTAVPEPSDWGFDDELRTVATLATVASGLVDAGRVVPGLTVDIDGSARSWWWPLPGAGDRAVLRALVRGPTVDDHRLVADELARLVDTEVRARLGAGGVDLVPRRPGRRTVPEAWLHSLVRPDGTLPESLDRAKVSALAAAVGDWVRSGRPAAGNHRLCLRIVEPRAPGAVDGSGDDAAAEVALLGADSIWTAELLVQDVDEPSLVLSAADVWSGLTPLGPSAVISLLRGLGHLGRIAPELATLLDEARPTVGELPGDSVLTLVRDRAGTLADAGIGLLLPEWWVRRRRIGLRAVARSPRRRGATGPASATDGGLGLEQLVTFRWEAALGDDRLTKRELLTLQRAAGAKQALVRLRGQWLELHPGDLDAVLAHVGSTGSAEAADVVRAAIGLGGLGIADDLEIVGVQATGWLGTVLDEALHATVQPIAAPPGFAGSLRPYQERGVGWLTFLGRLGLGACLADDMGLGKTAQVIALLLADPVPGPTLVVCPVSVLGNWQRELARFAPGLSVVAHHGSDRVRDPDGFVGATAGHDVVLTTYSLVGRDLTALARVCWGRLVLDEAQQIKNPGTAQARAVRQVPATRRVAMTGTPVENRLSELWSIMAVLNPGLLGSAASFRTRFAVPIEQNGDADATERLRRITTPFVLRRLKTDRTIIRDLPDKIETTDACPLTREQATLYQAIVDELLLAADSADGMDRRGAVLAGLTKLKQVCNHPAHLLGDGSPLAGRSGKLIRVEELLDELLSAGDKALAFTQFRAWGDRLDPYLQRRFGVPVTWLHGGVPRARRDRMVAEFQELSGPGILLISLKAGGTGLNLTAASHVIHLDRWWNPAVEDQATDRAFRIGQRRQVQVHKLVTTGTVEERIDRIIAAKRELAERVVGAGETWLTELSTDELRSIVELHDAEVIE